MVNTLSGSVCAYRKETVKPRFIRIDEVMALLDVTQDSALINTELFEKYLERFREPARELPKHTWNKLKEMTNTPKTGENS